MLKQLTVFSIVTDDAVYANWLGAVRFPETINVVTINGNSGTCIAREYNKFLNSTDRRFVLFVHPDFIFDWTWLANFFVMRDENWGITGLVGACSGNAFTGFHSVMPTWCRQINALKEAETLDSCCGIVDRKHELHFDEKNFYSFHLYMEDMCYQEKAAGRHNIIMPCHFAKHGHNGSVKPSTWYNDYLRQKKLLVKKWSQFKVVTT